MPKACLLIFLFSIIAVKSNAIEPVLDQQMLSYFSMTFDVGVRKEKTYDYGLRLDQGFTQPGHVIPINQLILKPAAFNIKMDKHGIKALEFNGVNFAERKYTYHASEVEENTSTDTADEPVKKTKSLGKYIDEAPTGVLMGLIIGTVALYDSLSSN